jgi:DNA-binding SARP family transcriptional activator/pimeloyl-ACP methyl ester carboxylesterase
MRVEIRLLGRFEVAVEGRAVPPGAWTRRHAAALVKLLALAPDRRLHREQVMDALWPDVDSDTAATRLHKAAHYARKALAADDAVVLARAMVMLLPDAEVAIDVATFEVAAREGRIEEALACHTGDLLPEDPYEQWAFVPRERVRLCHRQVLRAAQRWDELVQLDPTDEGAHVGRIAQLLEVGDAAGARRQFAALERALHDELGIGPSSEALALYERAHRDGVVSNGPARDPRHSDLAEQTIRFCATPDGVRLAYAVSGAGPPLVKASNWLTHLDYDWASPVWSHWWRGLSAHYTLIRYDERGCGLSDWDVDDFDLDAWVRDLETVVDTLGIEQFPLLGISQGGPIAIRYAARHPERVTRLVLYGTGAQGRRVKARTPEELESLDALVALMRLSWGTDQPLFRTLFTGMFMPEAPIEQWRAFDELQRKTASPQNAARLWEGFQRIDVLEEARSLRLPTLILHARNERNRPYADAAALAAAITGSRLVALEGSNHILQRDEPAFAQFLDDVTRFLEADPQSGSR